MGSVKFNDGYAIGTHRAIGIKMNRVLNKATNGHVMSFGLPLFKMKIFLFCYQQACKQKNATLLDIMSASENMKVQDLILESKRSSLCWYYGFWFDLVSLGGYLWYNSSGANVSYRNFGDFDTEEIYVQYSVGVLYLNPQNTMKWKIVLNSSHTSICSICQKGEILTKNT